MKYLLLILLLIVLFICIKNTNDFSNSNREYFISSIDIMEDNTHQKRIRNIIKELKNELKENNTEKINLDLASLYNQLGNTKEANKYVERAGKFIKGESLSNDPNRTTLYSGLNVDKKDYYFTNFNCLDYKDILIN